MGTPTKRLLLLISGKQLYKKWQRETEINLLKRYHSLCEQHEEGILSTMLGVITQETERLFR